VFRSRDNRVACWVLLDSSTGSRWSCNVWKILASQAVSRRVECFKEALCVISTHRFACIARARGERRAGGGSRDSVTALGRPDFSPLIFASACHQSNTLKDSTLSHKVPSWQIRTNHPVSRCDTWCRRACYLMCASDPGRLKYPANIYKPPATFVDQTDILKFDVGEQEKFRACSICGELKSDHPHRSGVHYDSGRSCFICGKHHKGKVSSSLPSRVHC
jgi:hypothetical protein